ncbi:MAG: protein phosphatase 2C domain-containing protein [Rhodothermales bacterium]
MHIEAFTLPKAGHTREQNEDAFSIGTNWPLHLAVADGATETGFARLWASCLAEAAAHEDTMEQTIAAARQHWAEGLQHQPAQSWYAQAKADEGADATLLRVTIFAEGHWTAEALGDTVLFHLRPTHEGDLGELLRWPLAEVEAFDTRPALLHSRMQAAEPAVLRHGGEWQAGDVLLLATDALAAWLMEYGPARALSWDSDSFVPVIDAARTTQAMRNDDVTLLLIRFDDTSGDDDA